jgi:hypothetical protein
MTCHGILKPFKFYSSSLCCKNFLLSHTGQNIYTESKLTLQEFNVETKLFKVVHDNGANMVKANKLSLINMNEEDELTNDDDKLENDSISKDYDSFVQSNIDLDDEGSELENIQDCAMNEIVDDFLKSFEREKKIKSNRCFDHTLQLTVNDSKAECVGVAKTMKKIFIIASKSHLVHVFVNFFTEKGIKSRIIYIVSRLLKENSFINVFSYYG